MNWNISNPLCSCDFYREFYVFTICHYYSAHSSTTGLVHYFCMNNVANIVNSLALRLQTVVEWNLLKLCFYWFCVIFTSSHNVQVIDQQKSYLFFRILVQIFHGQQNILPPMFLSLCVYSMYLQSWYNLCYAYIYIELMLDRKLFDSTV